MTAEVIFGVGLWRRRLAACTDTDNLGAGGALFALIHHLGRRDAGTAAQLAGLTGLPPSSREPQGLAESASLPDWLAAHLVQELGEDEAWAFSDAINVPGPICVRVNLARCSREALQDRLTQEGMDPRPCPHSPLGLVLSGRPNIYGSGAYREGLFEVQDEGSQLLGLLVEAQPGERLLDYCAGAGGKTLLLGAAQQNTGALLAWDPDVHRMDRLRQRSSKAGLTRLQFLMAPPGPEVQVDRVLVDAPCSELGALRRGPDLRFRLKPETFQLLPPLQTEVLNQAAATLKRGGRLVYATCTLNRAENEDIALAFESAHPDFTRVRPGAGWLSSSFVKNGFFRTLPHLHGTDGFFAAVWQRDEKP